MTVVINGSTGIDKVQDGVVTDTKLNLTANSAEIKEALNASNGAPIYACRAWVNFNGTGTVTIRASGNVSSITDNGVGNYIANFATAMPDVNYSLVVSGGSNQTANYYSGSVAARVIQPGVTATTSANVFTGYQYTVGSSLEDWGYVYLAVFR